MKRESHPQNVFLSPQAPFMQLGASSSFFWLTVSLYSVTALMYALQIAAFIAVDFCPFLWLTPFISAVAFLQVARACRRPEEHAHRLWDAIRFLQGYYRILLGLTVVGITVAVCGFVILSTAPVNYERELAALYNAYSHGLYQKLYSLFVTLTEGAYYENFIRTLEISFVAVGMIVFALAAIVYWLILSLLQSLLKQFAQQEPLVAIPLVLPVLCYTIAGLALVVAVPLVATVPLLFFVLVLFACAAFIMGFMVQKIRKAFLK